MLMRRLALAAAAALAACSVKLEGAPCTTDANCPDEQRCDLAAQQCVTCVPDPSCTGDGFTCAGTSLRECRTNVSGCRYSEVTPCQSPQVCGGGFPTASCQCPQEDTVLGKKCTTEGARTCDRLSGDILVCAVQGGCPVWAAAPGATCTSQGLVCREPTAGSPVCVCGAYSGTDLFADPLSGSAAADAVNPTGALTPAVCRYRSLADALAAATAGDTVKMTGWTAAEVKFSAAASGESFPLTVKPGVTLTTTDSSPVPAHYVIEVDLPGALLPVLELDHDTAASGFTVRPGIGGTAADAVLIGCTGPGSSPVRVTWLVLDGQGALPASAIGDALHVQGPCSVTVSDVVAQRATGAGIRVRSSSPSVSTASVISVGNSRMQANGDGGLVVDVDASLLKPQVSITDNQLTLNLAATPYTDATAGVTRKGGGVVLLGAAPSPLTFTGNRVYGNSYDQILVNSSDTWGLSGGASCGQAANTIACYDAGNGKGIAAIGGAQVIAHYESWQNTTPQSGTDYFQALLSGSSVDPSSACAKSALTCQ